MTVTIGPFTNVPAPGDPIRSPWAQQLTEYAVDNITEAFRLFGERPVAFQNGTYTNVRLAWAAKMELVTTNASGGFTIGWSPYTFSSAPVVLMNSAHDGSMFVNPTTIAVGGANAVARSASGPPLANTPFYVNWAAFGLALG